MVINRLQFSVTGSGKYQRIDKIRQAYRLDFLENPAPEIRGRNGRGKLLFRTASHERPRAVEYLHLVQDTIPCENGGHHLRSWQEIGG